jgi:hypothetical protein
MPKQKTSQTQKAAWPVDLKRKWQPSALYEIGLCSKFLLIQHQTNKENQFLVATFCFLGIFLGMYVLPSLLL